VLRIRHSFRLMGEFVAYAIVNRSWWLPALACALALLMLLVVVGQTAAPVALYPLF
jgi:hypothetical protein